jgi:hypothetical protein
MGLRSIGWYVKEGMPIEILCPDHRPEPGKILVHPDFLEKFNDMQGSVVEHVAAATVARDGVSFLLFEILANDFRFCFKIQSGGKGKAFVLARNFCVEGGLFPIDPSSSLP